jgi:ParB-like chromosome segregation protein Spo0J
MNQAQATLPFSTEISSVEKVPARLLLPADSPRLQGEDAGHVAALAQVEDILPPIVVHRRTMRVIDGMHRLRAAQLRGEHEIAVRFFEGDESAAFVLAVSANIVHGLPLTRADRAAAAERILASHPLWSDRSIGVRTGLAAATVARIRQRCAGLRPQPEARIGRDGRVRPVDRAAGRQAASALMAQRPGASLREIAASAGISVTTALDVRRRLGRGEDPVPPPRKAQDKPRGGAADPEPGPRAAPEPVVILEKLRRDPSLRYNEQGRQVLACLSAQTVSLKQLRQAVDRLPPHGVAGMPAFART